MGVTLPSGDYYLYRDTDLPTPGSDRTVSVRVKVSNPVAYASFYSYWYHTFADGLDFESLWQAASDPFGGAQIGKQLIFGSNNLPAYAHLLQDSPLAADTEACLTITIASNVRKLYVNGVQVGQYVYADTGNGAGSSATVSTVGGTFDIELLGGDSYNETSVTVRDYRQWSVALSPAEVAAEYASPSAIVHTANLYAWTPLATQDDLLDVSGNNRHWLLHTPPETTVTVGESFSPIVWVEFDSTDGTTQAWAATDIADPSSYYHGFKTGKVLEFGRIIRALSDEKGSYETQKFSVDVSDAEDRYLATLLGSDTTRLIINRRLVLRMVDDQLRRTFQTPLTVGIGLIRSYSMR